MFEVEKDDFGEDVLVATFGQGTVSMHPAVTENDEFAMYFKDTCEVLEVGGKLPGMVVDGNGTRLVFKFDNTKGLDALIDTLKSCLLYTSPSPRD